ncbi:MAG: ATP-grasp domain-containing protein [Clostridia bacterium]|nr:ATP-grasp domain-containing protein [Clostridia bacterium]
MREIRILFTGIGRRVELMQAFHNAAATLNKKVIIYGADMATTAPALAYCDHIRIVCGMKGEEYIPQLLDICQKDSIDLVIPTIDTDLKLLADNKERFEEVGTRVLISAPDMISICRDKNRTSQFFIDCGLKAPMPCNDYKKYNSGFPAFIKPKDGSSSLNAYRIEDAEELAFYAHIIDGYIIQPFITGKEYTVDIFCDFDGKPVSIVPRERVAVRSGEVLKTRICLDETIIEQAKAIVNRFRPCGPMTVQLIKDSRTGDNYYIEINPRYGGGSPLSMRAGARSAETVLKLLDGDKIDYLDMRSIADGALYSRFDQCVCTDYGNASKSVRGVIFDLDDTLYSEKDYIRSGFRAVAEYLGNEEYAQVLWAFFEAGEPAVDRLLEQIGQTEKKEECLNIYREHNPEIEMYPCARDMLLTLKEKGVKIGIITDGRPSGQRKKIAVFGLESIVDDIIITDALGGVQFRKPNDISFRIMQNRWRIPFENLIYVGDNPVKDFQAPRQLGMKTLFFNNSDGLYSAMAEDNEVFGDRVDSTEEIREYLSKLI